jgi:hypothetical protein
MNATGPPRKSEARGQTGRRGELIAELRAYHRPGLGQSGIIWKRWEQEAAGLFREYWSTGNQKHFRAFVRHVVAMRWHGARLAR